MLGASLGGIGKKVSTVTTLGDVASNALRLAHEEFWARATPVVPKGAPALPGPTPPASAEENPAAPTTTTPTDSAPE